MWSKIYDPITNKHISVCSVVGKKLLKKFIFAWNQLKHGGNDSDSGDSDSDGYAEVEPDTHNGETYLIYRESGEIYKPSKSVDGLDDNDEVEVVMDSTGQQPQVFGVVRNGKIIYFDDLNDNNDNNNDYDDDDDDDDDDDNDDDDDDDDDDDEEEEEDSDEQKWQKLHGIHYVVMTRSLTLPNTFINTLTNNKYSFGAYETGGGGDCLFHSLRVGINLIGEKYGSYIREIKTKFPDMGEINMKNMRKIVGHGIRTMNNIEFIRLIHMYKMAHESATSQEGHVEDSWSDDWTPQLIVKKISENVGAKRFKYLMGIGTFYDFKEEKIKNTDPKTKTQMEHVNRPMIEMNGRGDLKMELNVQEFELITDSKGKQFSRAKQSSSETITLQNNDIQIMKNKLGEIFERTGGTHWGTDVDLKIISHQLNLGVIVVRNIGTRVDINCPTFDDQINNREHYLLIYNTSNKTGGMSHYQLGYLINNATNEKLITFQKQDLPDEFVQAYNEICPERTIHKNDSSSSSSSGKPNEGPHEGPKGPHEGPKKPEKKGPPQNQ